MKIKKKMLKNSRTDQKHFLIVAIIFKSTQKKVNQPSLVVLQNAAGVPLSDHKVPASTLRLSSDK